MFLAGEWTFAGAAFGDDPRRAERDAEYLRQVRQASDGYPQVWSGARGAEFTADLLALRAAATEFVDEAARRVLATGARVIGCTSTFEQHVASLALLRRIRELDPERHHDARRRQLRDRHGRGHPPMLPAGWTTWSPARPTA